MRWIERVAGTGAATEVASVMAVVGAAVGSAGVAVVGSAGVAVVGSAGVAAGVAVVLAATGGCGVDTGGRLSAVPGYRVSVTFDGPLPPATGIPGHTDTRGDARGGGARDTPRDQVHVPGIPGPTGGAGGSAPPLIGIPGPTGGAGGSAPGSLPGASPFTGRLDFPKTDTRLPSIDLGATIPRFQPPPGLPASPPGSVARNVPGGMLGTGLPAAQLPTGIPGSVARNVPGGTLWTSIPAPLRTGIPPSPDISGLGVLPPDLGGPFGRTCGANYEACMNGPLPTREAICKAAFDQCVAITTRPRGF